MIANPVSSDFGGFRTGIPEWGKVATVSANVVGSISSDAPIDIDGLTEKLMARIYGDKPAPVLVKCGHCGQWGARKCECKKCGAPIE